MQVSEGPAERFCGTGGFLEALRSNPCPQWECSKPAASPPPERRADTADSKSTGLFESLELQEEAAWANLCFGTCGPGQSRLLGSWQSIWMLLETNCD